MTSPAALSPTPFGRVVTAMVTPFDAAGAVDLPLAGRLARHLVEQGSDGLVVCGTTGESPTLSWKEQLQMLQAVREAVGSDAQVLAGTGSNCTAEAVEATREAAAAGADGALVVVPYYNKPPQDGLAAHFRAIAESAPELPLMLYNIPGRTGCSMAPETVAQLMDCSTPMLSVSRPPVAPRKRSRPCGWPVARSWRSTAVTMASPCRCCPSVPLESSVWPAMWSALRSAP